MRLAGVTSSHAGSAHFRYLFHEWVTVTDAAEGSSCDERCRCGRSGRSWALAGGSLGGWTLAPVRARVNHGWRPLALFPVLLMFNTTLALVDIIVVMVLL